jgi:hypothetical protein
MIKDNHVYTLNNNLKSLEQKKGDVDSPDVKTKKTKKIKKRGDVDLPVVKTSSNFYINNNSKAYDVFKMIDSIDDILDVVRANAEVLKNDVDEKVFYLIHKNDDLTELLYQLQDVGYGPRIQYQCGKLTKLFMTLNKNIRVVIKTQQLVPDSLDGDVCVSNVDVYNKMNNAMNNFYHSVFIEKFKSYYNNEDIDILDEYRTTPLIGYFDNSREEKYVTEIDLSKAYTYSFSKIEKVPFFDESNNSTNYDNSEIEDYIFIL